MRRRQPFTKTRIAAILPVSVILLLCPMACHRDGPRRVYPSRATTTTSAANEIALDLGNGVSMKLILIPAGKFLMGSPASENRGPWERQHEVTITRPFYMGVYEVTKEQYQRVTGQWPSTVNQGAQMPVEQVSWDDAVQFCIRMSDLTGATVRLPTEAEWEYACRAGGSTRFCYGDDEQGLGEYAWYIQNSEVLAPGDKIPFRRPHPVGQKRPNAFGLYDMYGNVEEWCSDWTLQFDSTAQKDPTGPSSGQTHIIRGGDYLSDAPGCRSAARQWESAHHRTLGLGFRVVVE